MGLTRKTQRSITRYTHIVIGLALGTYVYLPLHLEAAHDGLQAFLAYVGIPVIVATGVWMWKGHAIVRRRTTRTNPNPAGVS